MFFKCIYLTNSFKNTRSSKIVRYSSLQYNYSNKIKFQVLLRINQCVVRDCNNSNESRKNYDKIH